MGLQDKTGKTSQRSCVSEEQLGSHKVACLHGLLFEHFGMKETVSARPGLKAAEAGAVSGRLAAAPARGELGSAAATRSAPRVTPGSRPVRHGRAPAALVR